MIFLTTKDSTGTRIGGVCVGCLTLSQGFLDFVL